MFILVFMIGPYVKYTPQNSSTPPVIPPPVTSTVTRVVTPTPVVDQGTPLPDPGLVDALNDLKADFNQYKKKQQQNDVSFRMMSAKHLIFLLFLITALQISACIRN